MPPKQRQKPHLPSADLKDENILQSVLLADPFGQQSTWGPLARQEDDDHSTPDALPWCLLPLLGIPLLSWTLDSLALGGVQQVFLFIRDGTEIVKEYLMKTSYLNPDSSMVVTIVPTTSFTPGDVLREVDSRTLLKMKTGSGSDIGTFILARCGYIGNLQLSKAAQQFTLRRKEEGGLPCLSGVMESRTNRIHSSNSTSIHLLDQSSRLVYFQGNQFKFPALKRIQIPAELFQQPNDFLIRSDLDSVGIDLCSVEVPQLFTENFDYQLVRPDFVHGILTSDLLGKTILCEVIRESENFGSGPRWATLVGDVKTYDRAARDIIARRSQPFVLDQVRLENHPVLFQRRGMIYVGKDVDLAPDCKIANSSCLASSCSISHHTEIRQSYIGSSSQVGDRCEILHSYVFDHVSIGNNTRIKHSIIGSNVRIQQDCVIEDGCLIGNGVVIGEGTELRAVNVGLSGPPGSCQLQDPSIGLIWPRVESSFNLSTCPKSEEHDDSDDDENDKVDSRNMTFARLGATYRDGDVDSPHSSTTSLSSLSSNVSSSGSTAGIQNLGSIGEVGSTKDFAVECIRSLERAFEEDHTVENATIELKTLRMASNVPQSQARKIVLNQVLKLAQQDLGKLSKWIELIKNLMNSSSTSTHHHQKTEEEEEGLHEMIEALIDLQTFCSCSSFNNNLAITPIKLFSKSLQEFYNEDVINEESILQWFKSDKSKSHSIEQQQPKSLEIDQDQYCKLREIGGKFLRMLMDADSGSSDES